MTTTLITGAGGFIGRAAVASFFARGHEVVAVLRPGRPSQPELETVTVVECDLANPCEVRRLMAETRPDVVLNLAVDRRPVDAEAGPTNVETVRLLADGLAATEGYLIQAGSSFEYGVHNERLGPATRCRPSTSLGRTKLAATRLIGDRVRAGELDATVLRIFHVYGPGEPAHRLIPATLAAAQAGMPIPLGVRRSGRDYNHIDDVVQACLIAAEERIVTAQPIDVCTGTSTMSHTIVDMIEERWGRPIQRELGAFVDRPWDREIWTADPSTAAALLDYRPRSIATGLAQLVAERKVRP
ncbi:MAG: NAD-dependent epimerase/dehydratase family protein [Acidimicrobiales bacterium]|nr:NAD-dependent epimerase/dehydratase family protein [Acidimicrobiales bacterium]